MARMTKTSGRGSKKAAKPAAKRPQAKTIKDLAARKSDRVVGGKPPAVQYTYGCTGD